MWWLENKPEQPFGKWLTKWTGSKIETSVKCYLACNSNIENFHCIGHWKNTDKLSFCSPVGKKATGAASILFKFTFKEAKTCYWLCVVILISGVHWRLVWLILNLTRTIVLCICAILKVGCNILMHATAMTGWEHCKAHSAPKQDLAIWDAYKGWIY